MELRAPARVVQALMPAATTTLNVETSTLLLADGSTPTRICSNLPKAVPFFHVDIEAARHGEDPHIYTCGGSCRTVPQAQGAPGGVRDGREAADKRERPK